MIFIVGARRSGTYWLQRIVSAHPNVSAIPTETHLFYGVLPLFKILQHSVRSSTHMVYADRDAVLDAVRDLCDVVFAGYLEPGADRLVERTPFHAFHLDLINEVYPDARFVHIVRDGRDVARSIVAQGWRRGPKDIEGAAGEWRDAILAARAAGLPAERYREVRYEGLLEEGARGIIELYEWLGLTTEPETIAEAVAEAGISANMGPEPSGVALAKWREASSPHDLAAFERIAGDLLAELGYPALDPAGAAPEAAPPRRLGRAARARLRSVRRGPEPAANGGAGYNQALVDEVLGSLREGALDRLAGLMTEGALVRIVSPAGTQEARAERGRELLARELRGDTALGGRQLRGDVFPGVPYAGVVLALEEADERIATRLVFLRLKDGRVAELVLYRLPSA
jgi:hypothetical protein